MTAMLGFDHPIAAISPFGGFWRRRVKAIIAGTVCLWCFGAAVAVAQETASHAPERLQVLLNEHGVELTLGAAHCIGDLTGGGGTEFAFSATAPNEDTGAYFAYAGGTVFRLADFTGSPELQCLEPLQAGQRNRAIRDSDGIIGTVPDTYPGHIVCGFVENTEANCWAYDDSAKTFVKVGWWQT